MCPAPTPPTSLSSISHRQCGMSQDRNRGYCRRNCLGAHIMNAFQRQRSQDVSDLGAHRPTKGYKMLLETGPIQQTSLLQATSVGQQEVLTHKETPQNVCWGTTEDAEQANVLPEPWQCHKCAQEYLGRCSPQLCQYPLPKTEHMELQKAWSQGEAGSLKAPGIEKPGCSVPGSWKRESSTVPTPTPRHLDFPRINF